MGRIKQGLDYFPLSTDFMHDRIVRRVMKREGDSAFTVLIYIMSYLYSGEGYYVRADTDFCDELSDQLSVRTTIPSAVSSACFLSTGFLTLRFMSVTVF